MRIVCISGIWCYDNPVWIQIKPAFLRLFPEAKLVIEEERWCQPWQIQRLRSFTKTIVRSYDDGTETLLIGHSFGGVIACAAATQFTQSRVRGIVSIFAPHSFLGRVCTRMLSTSKLEVPIISFEAKRDELVWWGTGHQKSLEHVVLDADHFRELARDPTHAQKIAEVAKRRFFAGA